MSELLALIDEYKDAHGQPSDASIARAIGIAPQTLSSWRKRGIRDLPATETLQQLAALLGADYPSVVLRAALADTNIWPREGDGDEPDAAPIAT
jgi:transcriptional regulator with XRE-family HTH domain